MTLDAHYRTLGVQPLTVWEQCRLTPAAGTALKYVARCVLKGQCVRDLRCARAMAGHLVSFPDVGYWRTWHRRDDALKFLKHAGAVWSPIIGPGLTDVAVSIAEADMVDLPGIRIAALRLVNKRLCSLVERVDALSEDDAVAWCRNHYHGD